MGNKTDSCMGAGAISIVSTVVGGGLVLFSPSL